jgi:hypothetical protein
MLYTRIAGTAGNIASEDTADSNATCTGATISAEESFNAGMGALRLQQGAMGAEAGA